MSGTNDDAPRSSSMAYRLPDCDDSALLALERRFNEMVAEASRAMVASPEGADGPEALEQVEAIFSRLEPIERAIMTFPAHAVVGLGVKARHVANVVSEYWAQPLERLDWDARAVRLLVEAVCRVAGSPVPVANESMHYQRGRTHG